jgi:hypothetical protein
MRKLGLAMLCLLSSGMAFAVANEDVRAAAARRVADGRERAHARFKACAPELRAQGFDAHFMESIWEAERFDVFEGVRLTLANASKGPSRGADAFRKASHEACNQLIEGDAFEQAGIDGVTAADLQAMQEAYAASRPDPRISRDRILHADCMKVNFNTHDVDYAASRHLCDCTLTAMHAVPDDELDSWLELAHAGVDVPMAEQAWYGIFVDKLWACSKTL